MNISDLVFQFIEKTQDSCGFYCEKIIRTRGSDGHLGDHHPTIFINMRESKSPNDLIALILYFDLLDSMLDQHNPALIGGGFADKYRDMDRSDPFMHIVGEIFRTILVLRNSFNHDKSRIDSSLSVSYVDKKGRNFKLILDHTSIMYIKTLANMLYCVNKKNNYYDKCFTFGLFKKFISHSKFELEDQFGSGINDVFVPFSFYSQRRFQYETNKFTIDENKFIIKEDEATQPSEYELPLTGYDFIINHNGKKYIIPKEIIELSPEISLDELEVWKC